jgi:hypothetical protein
LFFLICFVFFLFFQYQDGHDEMHRVNDAEPPGTFFTRLIGCNDPSQARLFCVTGFLTLALAIPAVAGTLKEVQWEVAMAVEAGMALINVLCLLTTFGLSPMGSLFASPRGATRAWTFFLSSGHILFTINYYFLYADPLGEPANCLYIFGKVYYYLGLAPLFVHTMRRDSKELRAARSVLLQHGAGSGALRLKGNSGSLNGNGKGGSGNLKGGTSSPASSDALRNMPSLATSADGSPANPGTLSSSSAGSGSGSGVGAGSGAMAGSGAGQGSGSGGQGSGGQGSGAAAAHHPDGYRPPDTTPTSFSPMAENSSDPLYCLFKPGMKIKEKDLTLETQVGAGQYGDVWRAQLRGKTVAAKRFRNLGRANKHAIIDGFSREVCLLASLEHPHVVEFVAAVFDYGKDDDAAPTLVVVTEYCANGSLFDYIGSISEKMRAAAAAGGGAPPPHPFPMRDRLRVVLGIAEGVAFLHSRRPIVIHRDLKSQNILLADDLSPKVCDFGVSRTKTLTATMSQIGTPQWSAPEVLKGERYSERADVFSFAVCMWEVLTLRRPFPNVAPLRVASLVAYSGLRLPVPTDIPPRAAKLMKRCWADRQQARPSMAEVVAELREICRGTA